MKNNFNSQILDRNFFNRPTLIIARELLGKVLVKPQPKSKALMITEVEAYIGEDDEASHARFGKTKRTAPMYEQAGTAYVYFIYGKHYCLNVVTESVGFPAAILIRAGIDLSGSGLRLLDSAVLSTETLALVKRNKVKIDGPGRVARFLEVDTGFTNSSLLSVEGVHFEDWSITVSIKVTTGSRVGVSQGSELPWRFSLS
jgi:DNA-3-methyladenine glycosylase